MNLSRALTGFLSSSNPKKWSPLRPIALLQSSSLSTEAAVKAKRSYKKNPKPLASDPEGETWKPPSKIELSDLPRPSEIPFQVRISNSVRLVGVIGVPVQLQTLPDGVYAVSVLVHEKTKELPQFWIPIIFQGDLAHIAACHLKEKDLVYVTGQLSGDVPPFTANDARTNIQVLVNTLSFVQNICPEKENHMVCEQDDLASDSSVSIDENASNLHLWNDLLANPHNWWDNRSSKSNQTSSAFKHKESGQLLSVNDSTPKWVLSKLDSLFFGPKALKNEKVGDSNKLNGTVSLWSDLVDNPQQWWDNRLDKLNGSVNPKRPDFKHKDTQSQRALWLDSAPDWVLPKLDGLVFDGSNNTMKQRKDVNVVPTQKTEKENLWRSLVENPEKWWDNRSNKLKPNHPDFKHKDTGEALWFGSSTPPWVREKLPPLNTKQDVGHKNTVQDTLLS